VSENDSESESVSMSKSESRSKSGSMSKSDLDENVSIRESQSFIESERAGDISKYFKKDFTRHHKTLC
jgi:hypothetical protein